MKVTFTVNGEAVEVEAPGARRLLDVLRQDLGLTGTTEGCGEGECGACSILVDGRVVNACLIPVAQAHGANIVTIEGLEALDGGFIQQAFVDRGAAQCGLCIPGMIMSTYAFYQQRLSRDQGRPGRDEIRTALAGNLCRCTGYQKIVDAVESAFDSAPGLDSDKQES